jgi:hypothetical protein
MSNINNALKTIGFLLASGATTANAAAAAPSALDPNDQHDDQPGRYIWLTPQGYGKLAGVPSI